MSYMINGVDLEAIREEGARLQGEVMIKTLKTIGRIVIWPFAIVAEAITMAQRHAALEAMSDSELARIGIRREQILAFVVGNIRPDAPSVPLQVMTKEFQRPSDTPIRKAA